jgi:predicted ATPase
MVPVAGFAADSEPTASVLTGSEAVVTSQTLPSSPDNHPQPHAESPQLHPFPSWEPVLDGDGVYREVVSTASLREVRLTSFKSFDSQVLPIDAITVLTGLNSSGKSNALDAIEVLSRLAGGEDLADALDGRRRESGAIRGGSRGCAPHKTETFALGCTVEYNRETYDLDVEVQVTPELRIIRENLRGPVTMASGSRYITDLLSTQRFQDSDPNLWAEVCNGKRGRNPILPFKDNRLLTTQLPVRFNAETEVEKSVVRAATAVASALRAVFHLDPIPHLMRDYVAERDNDLRRTGENLSAALYRLTRNEPSTFRQLIELVRAVGGDGISDIEVTRSELGDVMLALREKYAGRPSEQTPAREMSDGLLRFMAIATALLTSNRGLDIDHHPIDGPTAGVLLVIEELENGLHPSQSGRVLQLLQQVCTDLSTQILFTSHSPALLNELTGNLNTSVVVCHRDSHSGHTTTTRLVDLEGYAEAMAAGRLGDLVSAGRMIGPEHRRVDIGEFNRLLGIDG